MSLCLVAQIYLGGVLMHLTDFYEFQASLGARITTKEAKRLYGEQFDVSVKGDSITLESPADIAVHAGFQNRSFSSVVRIHLPSRRIISTEGTWYPLANTTSDDLGILFATEAERICLHAMDNATDAKYGLFPATVNLGDQAELTLTLNPRGISHMVFYADRNLAGFAGLHGFDHVSTGDIDLVVIPLGHAARLIEKQKTARVPRDYVASYLVPTAAWGVTRRPPVIFGVAN